MPIVALQILPLNENISLDLEKDTSINELFEFIKGQFGSRLNSDVQTWTCYSQLKRMNLNRVSCIGDVQNETLTINTLPNAGIQMYTPNSNLVNSSSNIQNYVNVQQFPAPVQQQAQPQQFPPQNSIPQQQQNQSQPQKSNPNQVQNQNSGQSQDQSNQVILHLTITDGIQQRKFQSIFTKNDLLEDVATAVLSYLGVAKEAASCDLIIFGQTYNSPEKRQKSLLQLSIQSNTTIDARLRWIGGSQQ
ncbi:unnamed protein product (macronuclear) [Paramecium tetraurelia]|uniref:Ubiquitin-like domain-containing protein n=1 Tax=Paramecium tetraurelia TaxID=5888 RepID=A0BRJ2_PARTE|nr:uncharacterized protein GSPATT00031390001 [Paramecium tetraurelia]CAK61159.1 unnamed protein product [Paramecium tetraurelia]|eukprot:XP_001428557.1 hypothetical protein (macronuclear) [Paramecium tetraurelia strain d4-2]